jgi:hypothetical protein
MASKPETTFSKSVDRHVPTHVHHEKMCNPYRGGTFDKWYSCLNGKDLWVEYKFLILPKRDSTVIKFTLSPLQFTWGRDRLEEGRKVAVIVGCKEGGVLLTDLEWEQPMTCAKFKSRMQSRQELAKGIMAILEGSS